MNSHSEPSDEAVQRFKRDWIAGGQPKLDDYLPTPDDPGYQATLEELVIIDLEFRWKRPHTNSDQETLIRPPGIESYLERFTSLKKPDTVARLAGEEFIVRRKFGDGPSRSEFVDRFPELADLLRDLDDQYPIGASQSHDDSTWGGVDDRRPSIENYEIVRRLGEGGMGSVYLAEQAYPLRRSVALKVIRSGIDSREVISRFEAERQALAMMEHPNIARVLDAGVTDSGLPFFAMELVEGIPITDFCQRERLNLDDRLALFVQTCRAIQHAHQKGILHRDLKPSNVLVGTSDGKPTVKVIDFGLAKALQEQTILTEQTLHTQFGQVVGTPQYMSPEQSRHDPADIDTRSDVYSLGIVLYELLTGEPPLTKEHLQSKALDEIMRSIREVDPIKPSSQVMRLSDEESTLVGDIPKTRLRGLLHGELDWIVMRSLEKDRERRYESPLAMAEDLLRYQRNEPVDAGPPSAAYRIRKFARRYAVPLTIAATFALLLLGGAVVTGILGIRAIDAEQEATKNLNESNIQRALAVENEREATRLAAEGKRQAASLALRQAENAMANQDTAHGLTWYANAIETAPESERDIRRVAGQNLLAWSRQVAAPSHSNVIHPVFPPLSLYEAIPVEFVGERLLCRLLTVPDKEFEDIEKQHDAIYMDTNTSDYTVLAIDDLSAVCPPIRPDGVYLNHWVDAERNALITLHYNKGAKPSSSDKTVDLAAKKTQLQSFAPTLTTWSGDFVVQQWSLDTGKQTNKPIRFSGTFERSLDRSFPYNGIDIGLENKVLFHHDPIADTAQVWSLSNSRSIGEPLPCRSAMLSRDGRHMAICDKDAARVYEVSEKTIEMTREHTVDGQVLSVVYSDSQFFPSLGALIAMDDSRKLYVWKQDGPHYVTQLESPIKGFFASRFNVFIGTTTSEILKWAFIRDDMKSLVRSNSGGEISVFGNEEYIAAASADRLDIWDRFASATQPVYSARSQKPDFSSGARDPLPLVSKQNLIHRTLDRKQVLVTVDESVTRRSDRAREIELATDGTEFMLPVSYDPSSNRITQSSMDGRLAVFDSRTGSLQCRVQGLPELDVALPIGFTDDHRALIVISLQSEPPGPLRLHRIPISAQQTHLSLQGLNVGTLSFHPSRPFGVLGPRNSSVRYVADKIAQLDSNSGLTLLDADTGERQSFHVKSEAYDDCWLQPAKTGSLIAVQGGLNGTTQVWDATTGRAVGPEHKGDGSTMWEDFSFDMDAVESSGAISADVKTLFSADERRLVNLIDGSEHSLNLDPSIDCERAAFSRDGNRLSVACSDGRLRTYEVDSLMQRSEVPYHRKFVSLVYFNRHDLLAITTDRRWIKVLDGQVFVEGGASSTSPVRTKLSPSGNMLASVLDDGTLQVWDLRTGVKIGPQKRVPAEYVAMDFSHDGQCLAVLSKTTLSLYPLSTITGASSRSFSDRVASLTGLVLVDGQISRRSIAKPKTFELDPIEESFPEIWKLNDKWSKRKWPDRFWTPPQKENQSAGVADD